MNIATDKQHTTPTDRQTERQPPDRQAVACTLTVRTISLACSNAAVAAASIMRRTAANISSFS